MSRRLRAAFWPRLDDTVFVARRYTFGTLICVADGVPIFEKEIKLGTHLVLPVNDVVLGHEWIDEDLIANCRVISAVGANLIRYIVYNSDLFRIRPGPAIFHPSLQIQFQRTDQQGADEEQLAQP